MHCLLGTPFIINRWDLLYFIDRFILLAVHKQNKNGSFLLENEKKPLTDRLLSLLVLPTNRRQHEK